MVPDPLSELLKVASCKELTESGGGHNQKGIELQKHWAIMRMFELEKDNPKDFLLLFETYQDVAILDSCTEPTSICIYQIKKRDRKEWAWTDLTALHQPTDPSAPKTKATTTSKKTKPLNNIQGSPLGKLYATMRAFQTLNSTGRFISNAGCDLPLASGANAATSLPTALSELPQHFIDLLSNALKTLPNIGGEIPDLSRLYIERIVLPPDDPGTHLVGFVHQFLLTRSPRHAGQARSLVDSLLAQVGPLGAKTDTAKTFVEVRKERGYSREQFLNALGTLETIPDLLEILNAWLTQLSYEGFSFLDITSIHTAATAIYRRQVMGVQLPEEDKLDFECDKWLSTHADPSQLKPYFETAYRDLKPAFPNVKKGELLARFAIRAIKQCVDHN